MLIGQQQNTEKIKMFFLHCLISIRLACLCKTEVSEHMDSHSNKMIELFVFAFFFY